MYLLFVNSDSGIAPMEVVLPQAEPNGNYEIDVVPDKETVKLLAADPEPVVYAAVVGGTVYKRKVYWTSTAALGI